MQVVSLERGNSYSPSLLATDSLVSWFTYTRISIESDLWFVSASGFASVWGLQLVLRWQGAEEILLAIFPPYRSEKRNNFDWCGRSVSEAFKVGRFKMFCSCLFESLTQDIVSDNRPIATLSWQFSGAVSRFVINISEVIARYCQIKRIIKLN